MVKEASQNIQVAIRVRNIPSWHGRDPNSPKNTAEHNVDITSVNERDSSTGVSTKLQIKDPDGFKEPKEFNFDYVFGGSDDQELIYNKVVKDMTNRCLGGYNGCIFAYGQTASGKTYTMGGPKVENPKDRGIIQRVASHIVNHIEQKSRSDSKKGGVDFIVTGSYLEIYQEELRDLLRTNTDPVESLKIRLDPRSVSGKDLTVFGLKQVPLITENDYTQAIETAISRRVVAETNMNAVSSRSHSVFTLTITQNDRFLDSKGNIQLGIKKRSKLHLIDLAGSERVESTGATGSRLKEGAAINQSLSCLGNVINALSTKASFVPYRDSKLTYLLSDSLGGNSLTLMIACVTPIAGAYEESVGTLRFAERAKKIVNNATVNVDATTLRIMTLEAENAELKRLLSKCSCKIEPETGSIVDLSGTGRASTKSKRAAMTKIKSALVFFGKGKISPEDDSKIIKPVEEVDETGNIDESEVAISISEKKITINDQKDTKKSQEKPEKETKQELADLKEKGFGVDESNYDYENYLRKYTEAYKDEIPKYQNNKYIRVGCCQYFMALALLGIFFGLGTILGYVWFVNSYQPPLSPTGVLEREQTNCTITSIITQISTDPQTTTVGTTSIMPRNNSSTTTALSSTPSSGSSNLAYNPIYKKDPFWYISPMSVLMNSIT